MSMISSPSGRALRPGDVVEVRSPDEILAHARRARVPRRHAVHAGDAPPRGPALHRLAAGRQDLRHDRGDRKPADAATRSTSRTCAATAPATAAARRAAGIYWKEAWLRASTVHAGAARRGPTRRRRARGGRAGGHAHRARGGRGGGLALPGHRGAQGLRAAQDVQPRPVLARADERQLRLACASSGSWRARS